MAYSPATDWAARCPLVALVSLWWPIGTTLGRAAFHAGPQSVLELLPMEDLEIHQLLRQLEDAGKQDATWTELQRYRAAALTLAALYEKEEAERKIREERGELKKRLRGLLGQ